MLNRTCVSWAAGIVWAGHSGIHLANLLMGGVRLRGSQYTAHTAHWRKKFLKNINSGEVGVSRFQNLQSFEVWLSFLRTSILRGKSAGKASGGDGGGGLVRRGIVWHCTGNPDKSKHSHLLQHKNPLWFITERELKQVHRCMPNCQGDPRWLLRVWAVT